MNIAFTIILTILTLLIQKMKAQEMPSHEGTKLYPRISDYRIFEGDPGQLIPSKGFVPYQLATGSFSDFAEKQRLVSIPPGKKMISTGDGLPVFPDGTILIKTFYYDVDKRSPTKGKKLVETRVLVKTAGQWIVGTYRWDDAQKDATLTDRSLQTPVSWINESGKTQVVKYKIPSPRECAQCHRVNNAITPIGPKLRNLNTDIDSNHRRLNQLEQLKQLNLLTIDQNISSTPNAQDVNLPVDKRALAYLDINCGHCHQEKGSCSASDLRLSMESIDRNIVYAKSARILKLMNSGKMPMTGTTVIDQSGIDLIKEYLNTLK